MHYIDADYISSMDVRFVQMSHFVGNTLTLDGLESIYMYTAA